MKKLFVILSVLLLLTGCGKNDITYGKVSSVTPQGSYVKLTLVGKDTVILADDDTLVYSMSDQIPYEQLLTGELVEPTITAYELKKTSEGYLAERIYVESALLPEAYTLSDGTKLNIRKNPPHNSYQTTEGWEILWEEDLMGPHNVSVGNLPNFDQLSPDAQEQIMAYYQEQGLLYDLDAELEKAYQDFLSMANPANFQPYHLSQQIIPVGANETIISYVTIVTRPIDGYHVHETRCCAVFDRETGQKMDMADLFQCPEEEAGARLLSAVQMEDQKLKQEMADAFRMEYVTLQSDALEIHFPYGSLPSYDEIHIVGIGYEDLPGILQPWAIPDPTE